MNARTRSIERKAAGISILVALQALACAFFLADLVGDVVADGIGLHLVIEGMAAIALLVAVVLGSFQVRSLIAAARRDEAAVAAAQGAMSDLIALRFAEWQLTAAEADVALFALKGCDIAEIAALRGSAAGTVRAQLTRVYAKAGVDSQSGLIALFLEELIALPDRGPSAPLG
ncbi:DNA-binding CsgD family transcriptional regulator [Erythromicrobium ramosum]|uniref:DNA-binding CsgD family transcriptional regulator n=1 Tax=Erythrobacter ramosus TaxID=35811 RepID=A0A6I4UH10_9SPHN|nr:helix-turn-helix transcriptional regulator [Erythrobacter ramosus]MBB3774572.1 DNA-binding CsgD family transcriptional regulator [Erythrobacter ramosus]MXP37778.1 helix-turn-helix transcriptional regulator [Erythrobacter ramosus]